MIFLARAAAVSASDSQPGEPGLRVRVTRRRPRRPPRRPGPSPGGAALAHWLLARAPANGWQPRRRGPAAHRILSSNSDSMMMIPGPAYGQPQSGPGCQPEFKSAMPGSGRPGHGGPSEPGRPRRTSRRVTARVPVLSLSPAMRFRRAPGLPGHWQWPGLRLPPIPAAIELLLGVTAADCRVARPGCIRVVRLRQVDC